MQRSLKVCAVVVFALHLASTPYCLYGQKKKSIKSAKLPAATSTNATSAPAAISVSVSGAKPTNINSGQQITLLDSAQLMIQRTFASLEEALRQPTRVYKLRLDESDLKVLPPEIGNLKNLQELSLAGNQLQTLPPEIGKLTNLQVLVLDKNRIKRLPREIGQLQNLQRLFLNSYNQNPDAEESAVGEEVLGDELRALWAEIGKLPKLITLALAYNRLTAIPAAVMNARGLHELYLNNNKIKELPSAFGQLTELRQLDLSNNELKSLPSEIGKLQHLDMMDIRLNQVKELPPEIGKLIGLHDLDISNNLLKTLPDEICNLVNLRYLNITNNRLTTVPLDIGKLNLQRLKMTDNSIQDFPDLQRKLFPLQKKRTIIEKDEPPKK